MANELRCFEEAGMAFYSKFDAVALTTGWPE